MYMTYVKKILACYNFFPLIISNIASKPKTNNENNNLLINKLLIIVINLIIYIAY